MYPTIFIKIVQTHHTHNMYQTELPGLTVLLCKWRKVSKTYDDLNNTYIEII